jgi:adenylate cyclase
MYPLPFDPSSRGHRVHRTFGFLDLCGFTDFVDANGDDAGVAELLALRSVVRDVAPFCGVRVDKWLGDGAMLVGVESEPLIICVLMVAARVRELGQLPMRAGIAAGEVLLLEGDDYAGRTVNLAARLCDRAAAHQTLAAIDDLVVPATVELTTLPPIHVRGMAPPVAIASLHLVEEAAPQAR